MPPAPPDSPVGRASGPVGGARRTRKPPASQADAGGTSVPTRGALETLLVDLGSQIQSGSSLLARAGGGAARSPAANASTASALEVRAEPPLEDAASPTRHVHATGFKALDARLGGGFPADRLSEICGVSTAGQSAGRTSLALGLLAETLARGVLVAWIDLADAFEPLSAVEAIRARGGEDAELDRLLWVRAQSEDDALRCCDRLLQTEGFELVFLDLFLSNGTRRPEIKDVTWLRLSRLAAGTRTALVVLSHEPLTGSRAELILEMCARTARFVGPPNLLEGLETDALFRRHRSRPTGQSVELSLRMEGSDPEDPVPAPPRTKMRRTEGTRAPSSKPSASPQKARG